MNLFPKISISFAILMHFGFVYISFDAVLFILPFSIITQQVFFTNFVTIIVAFSFFFPYHFCSFTNSELSFLLFHIILLIEEINIQYHDIIIDKLRHPLPQHTTQLSQQKPIKSFRNRRHRQEPHQSSLHLQSIIEPILQEDVP